MRSILLLALLLVPTLASAQDPDAPAGEPAEEAPAPSEKLVLSAGEVLLEAVGLLEGGDPESALAKIEEAASMEPDLRRAYYYRSLALMELGRVADADSSLAAYEAFELDASEAEQAGTLRARINGAAGTPAATTALPPGQACTYDDLQGQFTVTVDCAMLQDHTGHSQPHKRIWLGGQDGQFNIIEVPEPYRTVELDDIMGQLGRDWGSKRTPSAPSETTFAGLDARVVTEHKQRTTSTTWVFNLNGRNVIANAVALGKGGKKRKAFLAQMTQAVEAGFKAN